MIVTPEFVVIGGNQRLKALAQLGYAEVECEIVTPNDEIEMIEIAIASNDLSGEYAMDLLLNALRKAEMITGLENYHVNFANALPSDIVFNSLDIDLNNSADNIQKKIIIVPTGTFEPMVDELTRIGTELLTNNFSETILKLMDKYEAGK